MPVDAVALREVPRIGRQLPCVDRDELMGRYLSLSAYGPRALRELSTRILGEYAPEQLVHDEERQQECESVRWYDLPGGLTRFVADLSSGHATVVKHALQALSAPAPAPVATDGDAPERDPRTPAKRRADALVRLVDTAAGVLDGTTPRPVGEFGGTARILVTMDYATLYAGLRDAGRLDHLSEHSSGDDGSAPTYLPGIGHTTNGDHLDAGTLRRLACDADLIPVVLRGESEPLDVAGRNASSPAGYTQRSSTEVGTAPSPAATAHLTGATPTTSTPGGPAERPISRTQHCSAPGTTPSSTETCSPPP